MPQCPQCQSNIPEGNKTCNYCGYQFLSVKQANPNQIKFLIISLVMIGLTGFVVSLVINRNQMIKIATEKAALDVKCINSADCELPMDYAVRSNCPYQAYCQDYQCVVVCPMWEYTADSNVPISYKVKCETEADCDCSIWDMEKKYKCACLDNQCVAVVEQIE